MQLAVLGAVLVASPVFCLLKAERSTAVMDASFRALILIFGGFLIATVHCVVQAGPGCALLRTFVLQRLVVLFSTLL